MSSLLKQGLSAEIGLFRRPTVLLAVLALIFVPSLYVVIYVSSVWDPYGNLRQLPAALVNADAGFELNGRTTNLGQGVVDSLKTAPPFALQTFGNADDARKAVREGRMFFALIIPEDFSRRALSPEQSSHAEFEIYLSEGGNYTASLLSRRFGLELAHSLNEKINQGRWTALLESSDSSPSLLTALNALRQGTRELDHGAAAIQSGSAAITAGLDRASGGAETLAAGSTQLTSGAQRLTAGFKKVGGALDTIASQLPSDRQMAEMAEGGDKLVQGSAALRAGLTELQQGKVRLDDGANQLQQGAQRVPVFGHRLSAGAGQLKSGIETLGGGIDQVSAGADQLSQGMVRLNTGIQPLTSGVMRLNAGLGTLRSALPPNDTLDLFSDGMLKLQDGTHRLQEGLLTLRRGGSELSTGTSHLADGAHRLAEGAARTQMEFNQAFGGATPSHLAEPVRGRVETFAAVPNNGSAFAPYFSALSLWIGAVMMSFVFYLRHLVAPMASAGRVTRWFTKAVCLYGVGMLQATTVFVVLSAVLQIHLAHPVLVWAMTLLGSFTFVSVVLALLLVLGDAGRLLAVVLLIFQLAASGGIYPVELSHAFYQRAHGYLPFTLLVRAFRATMFSAFEGRWETPVIGLLGVGAIAILIGITCARWKYLPREKYAPMVEF